MDLRLDNVPVSLASALGTIASYEGKVISSGPMVKRGGEWQFGVICDPELADECDPNDPEDVIGTHHVYYVADGKMYQFRRAATVALESMRRRIDDPNKLITIVNRNDSRFWPRGGFVEDAFPNGLPGSFTPPPPKREPPPPATEKVPEEQAAPSLPPTPAERKGLPTWAKVGLGVVALTAVGFVFYGFISGRARVRRFHLRGTDLADEQIDETPPSEGLAGTYVARKRKRKSRRRRR